MIYYYTFLEQLLKDLIIVTLIRTVTGEVIKAQRIEN